MPTWLGIIAFIYWEICIFICSVRLASILGLKNNGDVKTSRTRLLLSWLGIDIVLSTLIAGLLSFARFNGPIQYLGIITLLLIILYFRNISNFKSDIRGLSSMISKGLDWRLILLLTAGLIVVLGFIHPVQETDSLYNLNYILDWLNNNTTPYTFANNYVPLAELTYLPAITIFRGDIFFWLVSLKAILLVALALYNLGRELGLSRWLTLLTTVSSIAIYHYWVNMPSGISTIKNDMLSAAGAVLIALAIVHVVHHGIKKSNGLWLALGFAFVTVKFSGFFIAAFGLLLIIIIAHKQIWNERKATLKWALLIVAFLLITTGHYYLRNLIEYGNPFYPIQVGIGSIKLPGTTDLSGTSILNHFGDVGVWQAFFFPSTKVSPAGVFFPIVLVTTLVFGIVLSVRAVITFIRRKQLPQIEMNYLAVFILFGWVIYFSSFWSAGVGPDDIFYLHNLASLRYAEGILGISGIFLVYLLVRIKVPEKLLMGLVGLNLISQLAILYTKAYPVISNVVLVIVLIVSFGGLLFAGLSLLRTKRLALTKGFIILCFLAIIIGGPLMIKENRTEWCPWWKDVWSTLYDLPASRVYIVYDPNTYEYCKYYFVVAGEKLQHTVVSGTEQDLLNHTGEVSSTPDYVVELRNPNLPDKVELVDFGSRLSQQGYSIIAINDFSILLQLTETVLFNDAIKETPAVAWFMGTSKPPYPGSSVDTGRPQPGTRLLQVGDLSLLGDPLELCLIGDQNTV